MSVKVSWNDEKKSWKCNDLSLTIKEAPSGGFLATMCKQLCYVICVMLQTGSLDVTAIVLQMCFPHRVLWGFITFSDFDWQICWGMVKKWAQTLEATDCFSLLGNITCVLLFSRRTNTQAENKWGPPTGKRGNTGNKHVPKPLCCVYAAAALSLPLRSFSESGDWFWFCSLFTNSSSKGHLSLMLVKTFFFFTSSISKIYKSVVIYKAVCETHFLGSWGILFGEEYRDEREDKDWVMAWESRMRILTSDADMGFAALGGPRGAPGHTLTPEVLRAKQLLHLLPSDLYAGLSHYQACSGERRGSREDKDGNKRCWKEEKKDGENGGSKY